MPGGLSGIDRGSAGAGAGGGAFYLITDCGSTTTKAVLIGPDTDGYRLLAQGAAPTTVEAPHEDVTFGVLRAAAEVGELTGREILDEARGALVQPASGGRGVDDFLCTSSAGGGLQMLVMGVVRGMTAESAERAALGAGAIVTEIIALSDERPYDEHFERLRSLRPDMILLSGGIDGGTQTHVLRLAELIAAVPPPGRLGGSHRLPVIYAGNRDVWPEIARLLRDKVDLVQVENLRPTLERENLEPTRRRIQALFMEHVMAHAPGYSRLVGFARPPILPTPAAVGGMVQRIASRQSGGLLVVDIGGATTDVFTVRGDDYRRSVSANLGLSYSIANVCKEAGLSRLARWLPFAWSERELRNVIKNKMIRPTCLPQRLEDLILEQAVAREALRLALAQHRLLRSGLKGISRSRTLAEAFAQDRDAAPWSMEDVGLIVGSGGVLAHAPRRQQAAAILIDACEPIGLTELALDPYFILPHLGALAQVDPQAADDVLIRDGLLPLGICVAPGTAPAGAGRLLARCRIEAADMASRQEELRAGELRRLECPASGQVDVTVRPERGIDFGEGPGQTVRGRFVVGPAGVILDGRGRPLPYSEDPQRQCESAARWIRALALYPDGRS
jgi:uncharacterized protein (TIGR01319 family)